MNLPFLPRTITTHHFPITITFGSSGINAEYGETGFFFRAEFVRPRMSLSRNLLFRPVSKSGSAHASNQLVAHFLDFWSPWAVRHSIIGARWGAAAFATLLFFIPSYVGKLPLIGSVWKPTGRVLKDHLE
eukprot:TRINITY_DN6824_c0_g2_i2.p1 TRINITY_DN6824_c0_g2~~TRINITY_DN6824_c0_g2_i2.p1  ORF type:complete len:130 (-),score=15.12 TRINITY_DN6824_c0_g2_i2:148-537(-)